MFYFNKQKNCIVLDGFSRSKYINLSSLDKVNVLLNKANKRDNLFARLIENWKGEGYLVNLTNYNIKPAAYDLSGKNLELKETHEGQILLILESTEQDTLFLGDQYKEVSDYIGNFLSKREYYTTNRIPYKTGILLHGKPGEGKTQFIKWIVNTTLPEDSTRIWCGSNLPDTELLNKLRKLPQLKVLIFEELTNSLSHPSTMRKFLDLMDGESSLDNCITIATTNYPENLPSNVVERPSRFDKIVKFGDHNEDIRKLIISKFIGANVPKKALVATEGMTIAQIKEICLLSQIHGMDLLEAIEKMKAHTEMVKNAFAKPSRMGF